MTLPLRRRISLMRMLMTPPLRLSYIVDENVNDSATTTSYIVDENVNDTATTTVLYR